MGRRKWVDTDKWNDPEFRKIPPGQKLLLIYLQDKADPAGFVRMDPEGFSFELCMDKPKVVKGLQAVSWAFYQSQGWLFIKGHLQEQRTWPLDPNQNVHKPILRTFEERVIEFPGLLEALEAGKQWECTENELDLKDPRRALEGASSGSPSLSSSNTSSTSSKKKRVDKGGEFKKPTRVQVQKQITAKGYDIEAQEFLDIQEKRGWELNNGKLISCWKAALSMCERKQIKWAAEDAAKAGEKEKGGAKGLKFDKGKGKT